MPVRVRRVALSTNSNDQIRPPVPTAFAPFHGSGEPGRGRPLPDPAPANPNENQPAGHQRSHQGTFEGAGGSEPHFRWPRREPGQGKGCRLGEARALRWKHVDFDSNRLIVPGTKSDSSNRVIPMSAPLRDLLQRLLKENPRAVPLDPIVKHKSARKC